MNRSSSKPSTRCYNKFPNTPLWVVYNFFKLFPLLADFFSSISYSLFFLPIFVLLLIHCKTRNIQPGLHYFLNFHTLIPLLLFQHSDDILRTVSRHTSTFFWLFMSSVCPLALNITFERTILRSPSAK